MYQNREVISTRYTMPWRRQEYHYTIDIHTCEEPFQTLYMY